MKSLLPIFCLLLCSTACLHAQPGKLVLARQSISASGAGVSTSSTRTLYSSLAEPFAGVSKSATRILYSGFLFPRVPSGQTEVRRLPQVPSGIVLHQNYPNPVSRGQQTNIVYELDVSAYVQLHLFNMLGQKVSTVVDNYYHSGTYRTAINAKGLPSGLYVAELVVSTSLSKRIQRICMTVIE